MEELKGRAEEEEEDPKKASPTIATGVKHHP
jgi:hypothetical protein